MYKKSQWIELSSSQRILAFFATLKVYRMKNKKTKKKWTRKRHARGRMLRKKICLFSNASMSRKTNLKTLQTSLKANSLQEKGYKATFVNAGSLQVSMDKSIILKFTTALICLMFPYRKSFLCGKRHVMRSEMKKRNKK